MVRERGWAIEELRVERGKLDEVFRQVTVGEDAPVYGYESDHQHLQA